MSVQVRPADETADARVMVPVKPLIGATVMVEDATDPAPVVMLVGLALMLKSGCDTPRTVTLTITNWVCVPLVPVTVKV